MNTKGLDMDKGVSVIIPCHYRWEFVEECLNSVFQQKNVDTQVVCVYNKTYDNDSKLLNELTKLEKQQRITLVVNEHTNLGAAYARNCGLQHVTKNTVMFVDDDDKIGWNPGKTDVDPYYLEGFYNIMMLNDNLAMVTGDIIESEKYEKNGIDEELFKNYEPLPKKKPISYTTGLEFLNRRNSSCAILYRTDLIQKRGLRFNSKLTYHEDTDFVMRYALSAAFEYKYILEPVKWPKSSKIDTFIKRPDKELLSFYWYRHNESSIMGKTHQNSIEKWPSVYEHLKDTLYYQASLMEVIAKHPLFGITSPIYSRIAMDYRLTIKAVKKAIKDMENPKYEPIFKPKVKNDFEALLKFLPEQCKTCKALKKHPDACHSPLCPCFDGNDDRPNLPDTARKCIEYIEGRAAKSNKNTQNAMIPQKQQSLDQHDLMQALVALHKAINSGDLRETDISAIVKKYKSLKILQHMKKSELLRMQQLIDQLILATMLHHK